MSDLSDVRTFWGCIPEPEQRTLAALAELAQTPAQSIGYNDVKTLMQINGAVPLEERMEVLWTRYKLYTVTDSNPLCGDADGCVLFALSPYLGQIWACRLLGGCEFDSPAQPPCWYALTAPNG